MVYEQPYLGLWTPTAYRKHGGSERGRHPDCTELLIQAQQPLLQLHLQFLQLHSDRVPQALQLIHFIPADCEKRNFRKKEPSDFQ